ncbi:hypothetical protein SRRS_07210 [Sporomusa rhizae]|uniref:hypothetical protein n=1 Tax=Sporomusa rhizae TaxID=357999 RepID=UPI00352AA406
MARIQITISAENAQAIAALKQVAGAAKQSGNTISASGKGGSDSLNQAGKSAESLGQKLANVTIVAGGITLVLNKIKEAFTALVKPGINFEKQTEISRLGIAGVLMSMTKLNGEATKLPDALALSNKAISDLTQASGQIGLPLNELTETFQAVVGAGLTQKMNMKEIVDFTVIGTKAVKTMMVGVSNEGMQVIQELRSMISGNIDQNSQVARSLGITNADIEKAKQSAGGLFKYLEDKLSGFAEIVKLYPDTLKGKIDRLATVFQQVSAKGAEPFTDLLKQGLDAITDRLLVTETIVTKTGQTLKTVKLNPELIDDFKSVSTYIAGLLRDGVKFSVTLARLASGPASVLLSIIKLILDNAAQVSFTILAWMAISRLRPILADVLLQLQYQLSVFRMLVATSGAFQATLITTGTVIKSLLVTTGWGLLAVAIGFAADQAFKLYENLNKAGEAKNNYFKQKEDWEQSTNLANRIGKDKDPNSIYNRAPVYNVNPDVNLAGMDKAAFNKLEKFITALNALAEIDPSFKGGAVTVTSGLREWGGHVSGTKADISVQGMEDPATRQRIIALAKDFGIAVTDEVKQRASNSPEAIANWGPHLDLDMSGKGLQTSGQGDLTLKNQKDDAEALAKAKIALAEAISNQTLQAYINDLQKQQTSLDQRKQATEGGFTSEELPAIGRTEYSRKTAFITRAIAEAQIAQLEEERQHLEELSKNNNLSSIEDPINLQTQIVQKGTEIAAARDKLAQALQQLGFEDAQAQKELLDKVSDMEVQLLEAQGKTAEANRLRNAREKQALVTKLQAEGQAGAVNTVNKWYDIKQAQADFEQAKNDLELANGQLVTTQETLMNELATGTKKAADVTDEYSVQYKAKTDKIIAELQRIAKEAGEGTELSNAAKALLRQIVKSVNDFADAVIARIDAELQNEIAMINADRSLTNMQKQDKIDTATRAKAAEKASQYYKQAVEAQANGNMTDAINFSKAAELNRELSKTPTILDKIHQASKQALEDGLLDFFERGIIECKNLGDAVRNLAITVLQSIQKIYAQEMTKRFMEMFGLGLPSHSRPTVNGTPVQGPLKVDGSFAEGGSMDSGKVNGPGTETSDSILAWVGSLQKFVRIANGEFVMRGAAVRKYGSAFLERLNNGLVPTGMIPRFAAGGSLSGENIKGPQELISLVNNNSNSSSATIPLSIMNILDPNIMGKFIQTREGKKALLNYIKDDAGTIRRVLNIR